MHIHAPVHGKSFFLIIIMRREECNVKFGFPKSVMPKTIIIRSNILLVYRDKL